MRQTLKAKFEWKSEAGWRSLEVLGFDGEEQLSRPFSFRVEVRNAHQSIEHEDHPDPTLMVGQEATLTWGYDHALAPMRQVFGQIEAAFSVERRASGQPYVELVLVPPLLAAMINRRARAFANVDRRALAKRVLKELFDIEIIDHCIATPEENRPLALQVDESDFHFASRLLEDLGVAYHFEHESRKATLVLRDDDTRRDCDKELAHWDGGEGSAHWPGFQEFRFGRRAEPDERQATLVGEGVTTYPKLHPGTLVEYGFGAAQSHHLVERIHHAFSHDGLYRADVRLRPVPASSSPDRNRVFRPALATPRPRIDGVVRAECQPLDPYEGGIERDVGQWLLVRLVGFEDSICIPLAQPVANRDTRAYFIPSAYDEVLVAFERGDPDLPYVVGSIRNDSPAWASKSKPREDHEAISLASGGHCIAMKLPPSEPRFVLESAGKLEIFADAFEQRVSRDRTTILVGGSLEISATEIQLSAGMLTIDAGMTKVSGALQCDSLITNSVISTSYSPGAGNVW